MITSVKSVVPPKSKEMGVVCYSDIYSDELQNLIKSCKSTLDETLISDFRDLADLITRKKLKQLQNKISTYSTTADISQGPIVMTLECLQFELICGESFFVELLVIDSTIDELIGRFDLLKFLKIKKQHNGLHSFTLIDAQKHPVKYLKLTDKQKLSIQIRGAARFASEINAVIQTCEEN